MRKKWVIVSIFLFTVGLWVEGNAQVDARLFRYPDVSKNKICFVYGGDIWVVPKSGGTANRLSSPQGEELFPRFSPDGKKIAFTGNYDGNEDIYVISTMGGLPHRITYHGQSDRMLDWYPQGKKILFASSRKSGRQRFNQFYQVETEGGLPQKLPIPYGEFGTLSPDARSLVYIPISRDFRTWKRYRGGMAPDLWTFDLETYESKRITDHPANDTQPMWYKSKIYFLSDRGPHKRYNIWVYNLDSDQFRQITYFEDYDIHFPSIGPEDIVFEAGGKLYLLNLNTAELKSVEVDVVTDQSTLKSRIIKTAKYIQHRDISPQGKRVLIEARGEIFSLPAEHGTIFNLTRSSGVAERYPVYSPDGKYIAYWSDHSGEYQLVLKSIQNPKQTETLTSFTSDFRYLPHWSPDSKKIAFIDNAMTIFVFDTEKKELKKVDEGLWMTQGSLERFSLSWSPDSRWLTYSRGLDNRHDAVFLYDTQTHKRYQLTSGYYVDQDPCFDPEGKYLYFFTSRSFRPEYSDLDNSFIYPNTTQIAAVPLTPDIKSPLYPRNDKVEVKNDEKKEQENKEKEEKKEEGKVKPVEITVENFEKRAVILPPKPGNFSHLSSSKGKLIYIRRPRTGAAERKNQLKYYDLKEREEKIILEDIDGYRLSANREKILAWKKNTHWVVNVASNQKMKNPLPVNEMEMRLNPREEWEQIFNEAWRLVRDYFYDPNMHDVDWKLMKNHYKVLLDDAVTRSDVNFVIGELIAELNASHTYRGGGDLERGPRKGVGYLGIDWTVENGAYRIEKIIQGAPWDTEVQSPLVQPGINIQEGEYILAVNNIPLDTKTSPYEAFQGLAEKTVQLTVNENPTSEGAREVIVKTLSSETRLRNLAWIEAKRQYVEEATDGRVGYIYVPNTSISGQNELVRQFNAQFHKQGLIIDERFNSGGQIPDRFIELLNRKALAFWAVRDGKDWQWPPVAHFGPQVMLINGWSGSGGDAFPDYFKKSGLGPLVGTRTWGGLIGITGVPMLIDGGFITVPTFRMYNPDGTWFKEGHGVEPDYKVIANPTRLAKGEDPQLIKAVEVIEELIEENPPLRPERPPYEDRSRKK